MPILEYNLTHPYPRSKWFIALTSALIIIALPTLTLVNVATVGYELVPTLRSTFTPNDTVPSWWGSRYLPPLLRRGPPKCQPKDIGRGDIFRVSPSLFEYKVLSTWRKDSFSSEDEGRIEYTDGAFDNCYPDTIRFDCNMLEDTQAVTVGVTCPTWPVLASLETQIVFAGEHSKDYIGQYYGFDADISRYLGGRPDDYRRSVFGVLDVITTDSIVILRGKHLSVPVLTFSVVANLAMHSGVEPWEFTTHVAYLNGTSGFQGTDSELGELEIYRSTILNTMSAVQHAVHLDLGNVTQNNIFVNSSAVNETFSPNLAPASINASSWLPMNDSNSFYHDTIPPPYQTWAQALRAGQPQDIILGLPLTQLPSNSTIVTNYLCPTYQLKPLSSFLTSVFVGTATMILSAWAAWKFVTAFVAQWMQKPCIKCTCNPDMLAETDEEKNIGSHLPKEGHANQQDMHSKDSQA